MRIVVGEIDDLTAYAALCAIIRAAGDERAIDFNLNEREVFQPDEGRPFCPEIVDGNGDLAKSHLPGDILCERGCAQFRCR